MGEISKCSRRAEKSVSGSGNSGKRGSEMDGRSHSKDDKRKCSGTVSYTHLDVYKRQADSITYGSKLYYCNILCESDYGAGQGKWNKEGL